MRRDGGETGDGTRRHSALARVGLQALMLSRRDPGTESQVLRVPGGTKDPRQLTVETEQGGHGRWGQAEWGLLSRA